VLKHSEWARERMALFRKRLAALRELPAAAEPPATNGAPAPPKEPKGKARKAKDKPKGRKARAKAKQG
jgi:hypothetical protein